MSVTQEKTPHLFIQFAGQGVRYMDELRHLYNTTPSIRPFMEEAISEINRQKADFDDRESRFFSQGLAVNQWIATPSRTPELGYLLSSPISHPLIFLTQISHYLSLLAEGVDHRKLIRLTHSATGFSTGVVPALLLSLEGNQKALMDLAIRVQAMFFWQGIRTQMAMGALGVKAILDSDRYHSREGTPSCMASLSTITRSRIDKAIHAFQDEGAIHIAYDLFPGRFIISGTPQALARFNLFLKNHDPAIQWRYIPSTISAHSPLLESALSFSSADAEALGLSFKGEDLTIPVWANDTGHDLRESQNILNEVIASYYVRPGNWRKQIRPLSPPSPIRYVLDFGPGTGIASLTEQHIASTGIKVVRCALPMGRKQVIEEVLKEVQSHDKVLDTRKPLILTSDT